MAQQPKVFLASVLYDPTSKEADEAVAVAEFGRRKARIRIDLEPTPIGDPGLPAQAARLLRELGEVLRHTPDERPALDKRPRHRT